MLSGVCGDAYCAIIHGLGKLVATAGNSKLSFAAGKCRLIDGKIAGGKGAAESGQRATIVSTAARTWFSFLVNVLIIIDFYWLLLIVIDAYSFLVHSDDDIDKYTHKGQVAQGDESGEHGGFAEEIGDAHNIY